MLTGFPKGISAARSPAPTGDGESSPVFADLNGDNRNELIVGPARRLRPRASSGDGAELPGWPVRGDCRRRCTPASGRSRAARCRRTSAGAILGSVAVGDTNGDGVPEVFADDMEGRVYGWGANGHRFFRRAVEPGLLGQAAAAVRRSPASGQSKPPDTARLHRVARCSPTWTATARWR